MDRKRLRYGIGIQSFADLRTDGYVYVDKTEYVYALTHGDGKAYFLSRPRRFGKSLLLSTLEAYFRGRKDLFEGLEIMALEKEWLQYPVVHINLSTVQEGIEGALEEKLNNELRGYETVYGLNPEPSASLSSRFENLIVAASAREGRSVVILIDEYDKPLLNTVDDPAAQIRQKNLLKSFYGVLKSRDAHIRFAMLTGVARFGKVSVFSDLNNLKDISLDDAFNAVCGISESELRSVFGASIEGLAATLDISPAETAARLRLQYDGYHFGNPARCEGIYNPFSLLNAFSSGYVEDYWFRTGTPTFLVKRLINEDFHVPALSDIEKSRESILDSDLLDRDPVNTLLQAGYLTIKSYDSETGMYRLGIPNREVEKGLDSQILKVYSSQTRTGFDVDRFRRAVDEGRVNTFMQNLAAFFADFPYDQVRQLELHYQNVLYTLFKLLGFYTRTEYRTSRGRIDAVVQTRRFVYIFEFKLDKSAQAAAARIQDKDYAAPFAADDRQVYRIGVNFSSTLRGIAEWTCTPAPVDDGI